MKDLRYVEMDAYKKKIQEVVEEVQSILYHISYQFSSKSSVAFVRKHHSVCQPTSSLMSWHVVWLLFS